MKTLESYRFYSVAGYFLYDEQKKKRLTKFDI